jgi:hypothetical protein
MKKAAVFEITYRNYLQQLAAIDMVSRAAVLGAEVQPEGLIIPFYGTPHLVSTEGVIEPTGNRANFAVSVVLCKYVLMCPRSIPAAGDWVTYREFKNAGPLVGYFTTNTNKIIETTFSGNVAALTAACQPLNGRVIDDEPAFDISVVFDPLPRIQARLNYNDRDDEFPSQCSVLFKQSAEQFLDMESLAIAGTFLAGSLIKPKPVTTPASLSPIQ